MYLSDPRFGILLWVGCLLFLSNVKENLIRSRCSSLCPVVRPSLAATQRSDSMPPKTMPLRQIHDGFAEQRAQMAPDGVGGQVQVWVREVTALDWVQAASLQRPARADFGHCREVFMVLFKDILDTNLKQPRCDLLMVCRDDEGKWMFTRMHPSSRNWGRLAFTSNLDRRCGSGLCIVDAILP